MRKIKDILRLKHEACLSHERIAAVLDLSKGVVTKYVGLAAAAGQHGDGEDAERAERQQAPRTRRRRGMHVHGWWSLGGEEERVGRVRPEVRLRSSGKAITEQGRRRA